MIGPAFVGLVMLATAGIIGTYAYIIPMNMGYPLAAIGISIASMIGWAILYWGILTKINAMARYGSGLSALFGAVAQIILAGTGPALLAQMTVCSTENQFVRYSVTLFALYATIRIWLTLRAMEPAS